MHMTGKVNFRDDLNSFCGSMGNNFPDLIIRVIAPRGVLGSACDHEGAFIRVDIVVPVEGFAR